MRDASRETVILGKRQGDAVIYLLDPDDLLIADAKRAIVQGYEAQLTGELQTPGCSLVYTAGPRRFFMLCANGAALTVTLDANASATISIGAAASPGRRRCGRWNCSTARSRKSAARSRSGSANR